ncbi:MAG: hypothetical protein MJZ16_02175 [Bacteroidales bacterium]|nr:hypothetical protein [Bacteroidales bacterium]
MNRLFLLLTILLLVISCGHSGDKGDYTNSELTTKASDEILEDGEFLSVDMSDIDIVASKGDPSMLTPEQLATIKVVIYRFYRHVKIVDGYYVTEATSGKQLNMSEELFQFYLKDMNNVNAQVKELRKKGEEVNLPPVEGISLESILN